MSVDGRGENGVSRRYRVTPHLAGYLMVSNLLLLFSSENRIVIWV